MNDETRTFGAPEVLEEDLPLLENEEEDFRVTTTASPMDDLIAELGEKVERITEVEYEIDGRPGWWARFDTGFHTSVMQHIHKRAAVKGQSEPDLLKIAFLLLAESCTAIGKDDFTVFESTTSGAGTVGPFKNGAVEQALGSKLKVKPGERTWQAAIRCRLICSRTKSPLRRSTARSTGGGAPSSLPQASRR